MMKTSDASTLMRQSLRNRPSQLLYEPPAKRHGNKGLKSSSISTSSNANSKPVRFETDSKISCLPKPTECENIAICGSKRFLEPEFVTHSENSLSSFLSCQGDVEKTNKQKLQPINNPWLFERKPPFGRGMLLKRQLLYEHKYIVPDGHNVEQERQNSHNATDVGVCAPNLAKTDYQLSDDFNHNSNMNDPFLKVPVDEFTSYKNGASPQQIENNLKSFVSGNSTCQENIPSLSIDGDDDVRYILEEAVKRLEINHVPKSFAFGDWEAQLETSESPVSDRLLITHQRSAITQSKPYSLLDSCSPVVYDRDSGYSFNQSICNNEPNVRSFSQSVSDADSDPGCSQSFSNCDLKGLTNFYVLKKADNKEPVNVLNSETSSLSDETYVTAASHLSDSEEHSVENISRFGDSFNKGNQLSESNSCTDYLVNDSSDDGICSFKTSFSGEPNENTKIWESLQSFQENSTGQINVSVFAKEKSDHHTHNQTQDNKFNENTNNYFFKDKSQDDKFNENTPYVENHPAKCENLKLKHSPEPEKWHTPELSISDSAYSSCLSPHSPRNTVLYFYPSATRYKTPTTIPIWTRTDEKPTFKKSPPSGSTSSPMFFKSFKNNVNRTLPRHLSGQRLNRLQRHSWSGSQSNDCLMDSLSTQVKDISFRNHDFGNRSVFQFQQKFTDNTKCSKWNINYRKKCSEAGHRFIDTHCHIDRIFEENSDTVYGNFQEYREANADSFPAEFGGCVTIFCNPLTFNPRGSLFRSLVDEKNVWIAVGCHPKNVRFLDDRTLLYMNTCIRMPQVVAIGEIGLDYSGMFYLQAETQKEVFRTQIKLALDVSKPIVVHCRDAEYDCFDILKTECPSDWFIHLHCYMLDFKHAQKWLDAFPNLYIGLTPRITYKNAFSVRDTAEKIPLTRLVLETDAPYFIPSMVPDKQLKCSHPGLAFTVAETVAQLQGRDINEVLRACWDNSLTLYKITPDA